MMYVCGGVMAATETLPTFVQHRGNTIVRSFDHRSLGKPRTMKHQIRLIASVAAFAAFAAGASLAAAQDLPAPPPQAKHDGMMHEHLQAHAKAMHDILNIRPDQEAAWQAFTASMVPPPHPDMDRHGEGHEMAMTTPQRLDDMAAKMAEHQAAFQRHAEAVKRFYAVLTPQQQKAFDAMSAMMMHHMGPGGPMGRHGMGMGHGGHDGPPPPQ